jgi:flagellar hook-basal body complex protein FliE
VTVEPILPDVPLPAARVPQPVLFGQASFGNALEDALKAAGAALDSAAAAEGAFASGRGGLQEMVLERAQADVALSIASAAASRTAQALSSVLGMQI